MSSKFIYYVYAYLRDDGSPYYIGKGLRDRAFSPNHRIPVPPVSRIVFVEEHLSEIGALALERRMIAWYGRKDMGTGILRNQTDGGEGVSGRVTSEETRQKLQTAHRGRKHSPETRQKIAESRRGRQHSEETREKMCASQAVAAERGKASGKKRGRPKGYVTSEETKQKILATKQSRRASEE